MANNNDTQTLVLGAYEKAQFARIPIDFIFREPRVIRQEGGVLTMRNNPQPDVKTLLDLFTVSTFKRKFIAGTRYIVYNDRDRIIAAFLYYNNCPVLPATVSSGASLGLMTERFISEYIDRMRQCSTVIIPEEAAKIERRLCVLEAAYDARNTDVFDMEALGQKLGLSSVERVRQLLVGTENSVGMTLCRAILKGERTVDDFTVSPTLIKHFGNLLANDSRALNLDAFMSENGIRSDKTCRFILDLIGMDICSTNQFFEPLVIPAEKISSFNLKTGTMVKFFSDAAISVSLSNELEPFLRSRLKGDDELVQVMLDTVRCSDHFEHLPGDDEDHYALKWQYLQKFPSKAVRILYDAGVSMHTLDILDEYNRRAALYGIPPLSRDNLVVGTGHPLLKPEGKTGYWSYVSGGSGRKPKVRDLIESYLKSHAGMATLNEVATYVSANGLVYKPASIRTYMSSMCYAVVGVVDLFVHADYIDQYPNYTFATKTQNSAQMVLPVVIDYLEAHGNRAKMKELTQEWASKTGNSIRDTTLRTMIDNVPEALKMEKLPRRRIDVVLLLPPDDAKKKVEEAFSGRNLSHHAEIISNLKQLVKGYPAPDVPLSELIPSLIQYVPSGKDKNMIYKIIRNCDEIETRSEKGRLYVRLKK